MALIATRDSPAGPEMLSAVRSVERVHMNTGNLGCPDIA
jgi:hypothetical protein